MNVVDVVGCGALNYDRLYRVRRLARRGEHEPILDAFEAPGGSAANTIAHLASLGKKTGFVGAVGRDTEGERMLRDFRSHGVDVSHVKSVAGRSGVIVGFVDNGGERTLYPNAGANNRLALTKKDVEFADSARLVHLSSFVSERQLREQFTLARGLSSKKISFAPGHLYSIKGVKKLSPILGKTRVLFLNEIELPGLAGCAGERALAKLFKTGVEVLVVTLGELGCLIATEDAVASVPARKTKVVDATGAGDAFAAGFLSAMLDDKSLAACGRAGNTLAAKVIRRKGAR